MDADNAWGAPPPPTSPPPAAALAQPDLSPADIQAKQDLVKNITNKQEGLRALLQRVNEVQAEADKLRSGNETLQTYIDNLTRNNAMAAASGR
ncbi:hypothetical protein BMF94_1374 [Rhodotorula taiwanensis]|uniref:Uncharacterized protein n=1 Tax=Rhodotorula taiwanensis TaxID=741276 RepID=A0A2S5BFC7_9BASI|nr:hypothetical protein BMF94_1374 [Rhodotorula taiwanensis]